MTLNVLTVKHPLREHHQVIHILHTLWCIFQTVGLYIRFLQVHCQCHHTVIVHYLPLCLASGT